MATITKQELHQAYNQKWGAVLPIELTTVDRFIEEFGLERWVSIEQAVDMLQDYVASQGLYDEEAEQTW